MTPNLFCHAGKFCMSDAEAAECALVHPVIPSGETPASCATCGKDIHRQYRLPMRFGGEMLVCLECWTEMDGAAKVRDEAYRESAGDDLYEFGSDL